MLRVKYYIKMSMVAVLSIAYTQLVRKVRRFSIGFNLSYRLFLMCLIVAVPVIVGVGFAFGVLHRVLNPQLSVTDLGLGVVVAVTGVVTMFLGSRRKQLDSSLASVLPNASWRFYSQRGCSVFTYMMGRFFLIEIGKYAVLILLAFGVYTGFVLYGPDMAEIKFLAAIVLCPLYVGLAKLCYDLLVLLRRYGGGNAALLRVCAGTLLVSLTLFFFYLIRSIVLGVSEGNNLWELVARQLHEDLGGVLAAVAVLFITLAFVAVQVVRRLNTLRWVDVTGRQLEKVRVFKRLPELPLQWFKAIATVDWRRTRRSFYERMLPVNRVMMVAFIVYIVVAWWMASGAFDVVPREELRILTSYGVGILQISMVCGAVHSLFSMDADRYAYMLWRTTDRGFERVLAVRSALMSLVLYGGWAIFMVVFCMVAGVMYFVVAVIISLAAATVFGTLQMLVVSARWPHLEWREATDIERMNLPSLSAAVVAVLLLYAVIFVFQNVRFNGWGQNLALSLFLLALVPLLSVGLSLFGYRVLRKGIIAC